MRRIRYVGITIAAALTLVAIIASSAAAAENEPCTKNVLCGTKGEALRDDFTATAEPTTTEARSTVEGETEKRKMEGGFGEDIQATNSVSYLRFKFAHETLTEYYESPAGNLKWQIKLDHDETSSATECHKATGWVTSVQMGVTVEKWYTAEGPYKPKQGRGGLGPWPITFYSDTSACGAKAGEVVIENVAIAPLAVGVGNVTGTITGKWAQPKTEGACAEGGIKLNTSQPALIAKVGAGEEKAASIFGKTVILKEHTQENGFICTGPRWED